MAEPFPLYVPPEARRLFQSESLLRRFAQTARWDDESSLLELHGSLGALALTRALGCHLTVIEPDERVADTLKERARLGAIGDKVAIKHGPVAAVAFAERAFDGIFSFGRIIGNTAAVAKRWRPNLAFNGRLGMTVVVRVGRSPSPKALEAWAQRLGATLLTPRDTDLETALETTDDRDEAGQRALRDEIELHRAAPTAVSLGFVVARRKEPGEKPPPSRDGG